MRNACGNGVRGLRLGDGRPWDGANALKSPPDSRKWRGRWNPRYEDLRLVPGTWKLNVLTVADVDLGHFEV